MFASKDPGTRINYKIIAFKVYRWMRIKLTKTLRHGIAFQCCGMQMMKGFAPRDLFSVSWNANEDYFKILPPWFCTSYSSYLKLISAFSNDNEKKHLKVLFLLICLTTYFGNTQTAFEHIFFYSIPITNLKSCVNCSWFSFISSLH